jgi:hypothetical protein
VLVTLSGCGGADNSVLEEESKQVYSVDPDANISIHNQDGAIWVYGSDANELRVRSLKRAYSQQRLNQIATNISARAGAVSITAKIPARPKWALRDFSGTVDLTVVVPATASISVMDLNAGEVLIDSMHGPEVHARLNDGRIFARDCYTNLDLALKRGTLRLTYDWWQKEKFSAQVSVTQGNAWVFLPTEAALHLVAEAAHGKIANDFNDLPVSANASHKMRIDQVINGGGPATIDVRVGQGDIKIGESNP